jgi:hypothetical protein
MRWMLGMALLMLPVGTSAASAGAKPGSGAAAERPVEARAAKQEAARSWAAEPLAARYRSTAHEWVRDDLGRPFSDAQGATLQSGRVRAFLDEVGGMMKRRRALMQGTDAWHRPARRTLQVPEGLDLPPPVVRWLGPALDLQPARQTWRTVPTTESGPATWSTSAAKIAPSLRNVREAAWSDRQTFTGASPVIADGRTFVELDAEGHPTRVARVATEVGASGCKRRKETQLWTLTWQAGVLQRVDGTEHTVCDHRDADSGWARFATTTSRAR